MSNMGVQPIEFDDFSGGETDFYLLGDKKRYEKATNYLVNPQRKLDRRPGSAPYDLLLNHILPGSPARIGSFITFNQRRDLLVQQAQNIYYLKGSWTAITGPEGAPAAPASGAHDALTFSEWNGHTYFTSAGGGRPGKLYRTPEGEFAVRTAGLPLPVSEPKYTNDSLLNHCLRLANDLRASMVAHINNTTLHSAVDKWSLSYFTAQTWNAISDDEYPGPVPTPSPAPAATDEETLYALIEAMSLAYEHHGHEAGSAAHYHHSYTVTVANASVGPPKGPFKLLTDNTAPDNLEDAAVQLNELRMRWNWHRLGLFTHSGSNTLSVIDVYPVATPPIENLTLTNIPYVKANYSEVIRYANYLKDLYNLHASFAEVGADWRGTPSWNGAHWHSQDTNSTQDATVKLADATDLESAYLIIYWVWALYGGIHFADANIGTHTATTMDTTAGSANVVDVGGGAVTLPLGAWVIATTDIFDDTDQKNRRAAKVTASAAGTATLSKTLTGTVGNQAIQYSLSTYHGGFDGSAAFHDYTTSQVTADETPDPRPGSGLAVVNTTAVPTTLAGWIALAATCYTMLNAHLQNRKIHQNGTFPSDTLFGNGPFYKPQIATYSYAFVYKYTYTTENGVEFQTESEPIFAGNVETAKQYPVGTELATGLAEEDTSVYANDGGFYSTHVEEVASALVYNLPRLRNRADTNYDADNVTVEVFRTQDGGNTYYLLGEVANGTNTFEDTVSDSNSTNRSPVTSDREPLYTTGGEVARQQAPEARFMHILENTAYYGYVTDTGQVFPNRLVQSIPGAPDTGPGDFFLDLPDEIVGLSSCRNNVIALCRRSLYRITGGFNNLGQGELGKETIADELGCVSTKSIVRTKAGIYFAGTDGFYFTDGFQLIKLSIDRDLSYAKITRTEVQASRIYGAYDQENQRIWWSVQSESSSKDVDYSWIFHINYGVKPSGVFTSAANGTYWSPTAMVFHNGLMLRGDRRGLLFRHEDKYHSDPKIPETGSYDDFLPVDQWGTVHVPYVYRSCAVDFGTISTGNYVTKIKLLGRNTGNVAHQVNSIADNNYTSSKKPVAPMLYQQNPRWGDPTVQWGDEEYPWKYDGKLDMVRRMSHGNLRAQVKQIEIVPAYVGVYKYDDYPEDSFVDVDKDLLKVTLQAPDGYDGQDFPIDVVGMYIAFEDDDYTAEYEITQWAQEELTITDPDGNLLDDLSDQKWVIRGYMKESSHSIMGYVLQQAPLGERGNPFVASAGEGENG